MLFSFVKELDDESAQLLKSLNDRQNAWRRSPGVVVWAFWIGDEPEKAKQWAQQHEITNLVFAAVSPDDPDLAGWNIHPMASNTHVLACRAKRAMVTYTNVNAEEIDALEARLLELVTTKRD